MVSEIILRCLCLVAHLIFLVAGRLAPTIVYDDGCHLAAYIRNHSGRDLVRTAAVELLERTPISVDKMHFKNHVGDFCRKTMNPYENEYESHFLVVFEFCYLNMPVCEYC